MIGIWSHVREPESCRIPAVVILYRLEQERPGLLQGTLLLYGRIPRAGDWRRCEMDGPSVLHGCRIPGVAVWGGGTAPEGEHRRQRQEHRHCGQSGFLGAVPLPQPGHPLLYGLPAIRHGGHHQPHTPPIDTVQEGADLRLCCLLPPHTWVILLVPAHGCAADQSLGLHPLQSGDGGALGPACPLGEIGCQLHYCLRRIRPQTIHHIPFALS